MKRCSSYYVDIEVVEKYSKYIIKLNSNSTAFLILNIIPKYYIVMDGRVKYNIITLHYYSVILRIHDIAVAKLPIEHAVWS